ncbi:MAG: hypothetical protein WC285_03035 [Candidatus Gracilibacteria bacterium]|jgi:hypothetical protein
MKRNILLLLLLVIMLFAITGCQNPNLGISDNQSEKTLLSIEELASLNTKVKNGETPISETLEIYKKMLDRNMNDEGRDIVGNSIARETLNVLKEQVEKELKINALETIKILEELKKLNPDKEISDLLITSIRENARKLYEKGNYEDAYALIDKRFTYGFSEDDMSLKVKIALALVETYAKGGEMDKAKELLLNIKSILSIGSNSKLAELYSAKVKEIEKLLNN